MNHRDISNLLRQTESYPLATAKDLDPLISKIGNARVVMLGEASHGTHEYYTWRSAITKRLITEKGFHFMAVEGDWPDTYKVNRYIKRYADNEKSPVDVLKVFQRWPTWMWANWEIAALTEWLRKYNAALPADKRFGFYGLDVYSLWESMEELVKYLSQTDPHAAELAKKAVHCFEPYGEDGQLYAMHHASLPESCHDAVVKLLHEVRARAHNYDHDPEATLNTEQNAYVAVNAEAYYRNMVSFDDQTWNLRDTHMVETLHRTLKFHGPESKAVIWEHNTHIGDARYTDMAAAGMVNVGQLIRQDLGEENVVAIGFGSYQGSVMAGKQWGAKMETMRMPPARRESIEGLMHELSPANRFLIFNKDQWDEHKAGSIPHRAIGVVYHPDREQYGNYVPTVIQHRYDVFIYLDETGALHPLPVAADTEKTPETYPFNF